MTMQPINRKHLPNGLQIEFIDATNRYFGDYHRVCLRVVMTLDVAAARAACPADTCFWAEVAAVLGRTLRVEKQLERMGVTGAAVAETTATLIDDFCKAADDYMARSDYPKRLAQGALAKRNKPGRSY
jgi:hypothetical protein